MANQPRSWKADHDYLDRFFSYVQPDEITGCWLWYGWLNKWGYGGFRQGDKIFRAHRWAWAVLRGPIPKGLTLHHTCFNRACVNPAHLELMTHSTNASMKALLECPSCHHRFRYGAKSEPELRV